MVGYSVGGNEPDGSSFSTRDAIRGSEPFDTTAWQIRWWTIATIVLFGVAGGFAWLASGDVISHKANVVQKETGGLEAAPQQNLPRRDAFSFRVLKNRLPQAVFLCLGIAGFAAFLHWYDRRLMQQAVDETKGNPDVR